MMNDDDDDNATMRVPWSQRLHDVHARQRQCVLVSDDTDDIMMRSDDNDEQRDGAPISTNSTSSGTGNRPWYDYVPFTNRSRATTATTTTTSNWPFRRIVSREEGDMDDREQQQQQNDDNDNDDNGMMLERDGEDNNDERIHEPLKRHQQAPHEILEMEMELEDYPCKRRRIVSGLTSLESAVYHAVPALTEWQQTMFEYTGPAVFPPLFTAIGYTPFAIQWVVIMYIGHFLQTALSTFGPDTKGWRLPTACISPLVHSLLDTYLWNHSIMTVMLLKPEWFSTTSAANFSAYWMAVLFVLAQSLYLVVSLKTHYVNQQQKQQQQRVTKDHQHSVERCFLHIFVSYVMADILFVLARLTGYNNNNNNMPYCNLILVYIGLIVLHVMPIYLVAIYYQKQMDITKDTFVAKKKLT